MHYVVLEHVHVSNDVEDIYRITVGEPVHSYIKVFDPATGDPVLETIPVLDPNTGEPMSTEQNVEVEPGVFERQQVPATYTQQKEAQVVVGYDRQETFVFSANDERWNGKTPEEIADIQRQIILTALHEREEAVIPQPVDPAANAPAGSLPGVGQPLT